jgi:RNA polymerase sigma-B factor
MTRMQDAANADRLWAEYARRHDPRIREALVNQFERLAYSIASRFRGKGIEDEDLLQVARMGLVKAVDRFDPGTRNRFLTFATPTIVGELKRYFRDHLWAVHVPRSMQELGLQVTRCTQEMAEQLGRAPRVSELAARLNTSEQRIQEILELPHAQHPMSLDCEIDLGDGDGGLEESLGSDDEAIQSVAEREGVRQALCGLDALMQDVIRMRYMEGLTQRQVGERLGISQMGVCRIERRALNELRSTLTVN